MSKEMYISSSPHETKVAVLEDDQLVEVYFERDTDVGLVGGIYKGRVSRVLPGMQSAFVDIGLERDAFLYVSDFYEDQEEYDKVFEEAEARATKFTAQQAAAPRPQPPPLPWYRSPAPAAAEVAPAQVAATGSACPRRDADRGGSALDSGRRCPSPQGIHMTAGPLTAGVVAVGAIAAGPNSAKVGLGTVGSRRRIVPKNRPRSPIRLKSSRASPWQNTAIPVRRRWKK